ncbi:hypothetical protein DFR29_10551 [Tahibacter aquaticus]|uniref:Uncharacterized protein n=1 Tax=Tahibacter aquaticus TaxID=520092 RepID=A0A4R6Z034_9GAMM|nr:hypothetical protein [Tahibacter aquaticus]TDR44870.1 hypothetical protein DFR29_10551 [Tahibacter aquaticus]
MASSSNKKNSAAFVAGAGGASGGSIRRNFIDAPMAAARQPMMDAALGVYAYLQLLPAAFADSQRRELERLVRSVGDSDPRVRALKLSIEQAQVLRDTADLGRARIDRTLEAIARERDAFHGFVSDESLQPQRGLLVRISSDATGSSHALEGRTADDGYFRIDLGERTGSGVKPPPRGSSVEKSSTDSQADSAAAEPARAGRVEIFDTRGNLLLRDTTLLPLDQGTVYREYLLGGAPDRPAAAPPTKPTPPPVAEPAPAAERVAARKPAKAGPAKGKNKR